MSVGKKGIISCSQETNVMPITSACLQWMMDVDVLVLFSLFDADAALWN
jgi:hypothetical protein